MRMRYTFVFGPFEADSLTSEKDDVCRYLFQARQELEGCLRVTMSEKQDLLIGTKVIHDPNPDVYPRTAFRVEPFFGIGVLEGLRLRSASVIYYDALYHPGPRKLDQSFRHDFFNGRISFPVKAGPRKFYPRVTCRQRRARVMLTLPVTEIDEPARCYQAFVQAQTEVEARLQPTGRTILLVRPLCQAATAPPS